MYAYIMQLLSYLPGAVTSEVHVLALEETLVRAELSVPAGSTRLKAAVFAIEANAAAIFVRDDWFKAVSLELLKHVASA